MEINKAKVIATRQHNEVPGWHLHHTKDGRYWLDTAPGNDGSGCSELSSKEYESVAGAELRPYLIGDECVSDTVVYAASLEDALELAQDWERDGSWDQRCEIDVFAVELDLDAYENGNKREAYIGDLAWATVEVGEDPPEPECEAADEHDWCSPHSVLGGLAENPGVWSEGGTRMVFRKVCKHCGYYRTETSVGAQRNPGELDRIEYDQPDDASFRWVNSRKKTPARILADLWTNNGFGEVDEWEKLDRADLVRECKELLGHWSSNGWDLGSTTALDVVDFLEDEWSKYSKEEA